ncbi:MAG: tetratricopeptide repeat protein [Tannerella sp.]|jgi:tetratricopeptide (TPR) repeat protein|nr:tetratricopeptide repeat protein [Tannerella sp.]
MTTKEINNVYRRVADSLNTGALKTAFEWIQTLISGVQLHAFQGKLNELQETYRYMLDYYVEGSEDPMQKQIYAGIRSGAYELTDRIRHEALIVESPTVLYSHARTLRDHPADIAMLPDKLQEQYELDDFNGCEASGEQLFAGLWTKPFLSEDETAAVSRALKSDAMPTVTKCQTVSALLLGLQTCFDMRKLHLLFDAAGQDDEEVRIRAYVAVLLTLYTYRQRTVYYPAILPRMEILAETPEFTRILQTVAMRFILARETEKVSLRLREEIIPELVKFASKMNPGGTDPFEQAGDGMNPEWSVPENSTLASKIEEYSHMQEEGIDVMHSTFVDLKHFPFFHTVGNWFRPFMPVYPQDVSLSAIRPATIEVIRLAPFMCNSDKYSLFFILSQIPEKQRATMTARLDSQLDAMTGQCAEELKSKQNRVECITSQYVQDLFRFYKLFARRREFDDIFQYAPEFHYLSILKPYLSDTEILPGIAELYLRKGYFENAQGICERLLARHPDDGVLYQKTGYCKQMLGDMHGALEDYLRSEMLNPDSKWLVRRIGHCYKELKQPEKALEFYRRYEKMTPGNAQAPLLTGHCYMDLKNYAEALKHYFKADYMEHEHVRAWRAIAWCSFLSGKYEQARNYYARILAGSPQMQDCLNAGHTELALGQTKKALEHYRTAITLNDGNFDNFQVFFSNDSVDLIQAGVDPSAIPLVLDLLQYAP